MTEYTPPTPEELESHLEFIFNTAKAANASRVDVSKSYYSIVLEVDIDMILANISEYDGRFVGGGDAKNLLILMEQDINDWFYENISTVIENGIDKYIHQVMCPKQEDF